jgi:hypothetical protein
MPRLARVLALATMLAAMNLAGMTAAHAYPVDPTHAYPADPATDHPTTAQQQPAGDTTGRRLLARERSSIPNRSNEVPAQVAGPRLPAEPGGLTPALRVLAAVLALLAGVAVLAARRANRSQRAGRTA